MNLITRGHRPSTFSEGLVDKASSRASRDRSMTDSCTKLLYVAGHVHMVEAQEKVVEMISGHKTITKQKRQAS